MELKEILTKISSQKRNNRLNEIKNILTFLDINFSTQSYKYGENIVISFAGKIDKDVIFFAHHDISSNSREGANDNTSSVAVVIKVAQYLKNTSPLYNINIILNDNEEMLGALLNKKLKIPQIEKVIHYIGSYNYLKSVYKDKVAAIFDLELSRIGDSIYIPNKSRNVLCSQNLINYLKNICGLSNNIYFEIPVMDTDMISVRTTGLNGVVFGAIPQFEALHYYNELPSKKGDLSIMPANWKNIHTNRDTICSIQEKSLKMVYDFIVVLISNLDLLNL